MNRSLIVGALWSVALVSPAFATEPAADPPAPAERVGAHATEGVPEYEILYLAEKSDTGGPQAVVRTPARTEDEWEAIGRDLRAKRPGFPAMVVFFISEHATPIPEGYPDCVADQRQAFERWALGTYVYHARRSPYNETGDDIELVKQNIATPRKRTLNGIDVVELHAPDPTEIRNAPAAQRIVGAAVVVPGLKDDELRSVAQAYEDEFGTPRLMQIVFFAEEPDWADKPFMTQGLYNLAGRAYLRASRAKDEARTEILPLEPHWVTLDHGEIVPKE